LAELVIVEAQCLRSTAADIQYFEKDKVYSIDMEWAKKRGIWPYFKPLREIPRAELEDREREELDLENQGRTSLGGSRAQRAAQRAAG